MVWIVVVFVLAVAAAATAAAESERNKNRDLNRSLSFATFPFVHRIRVVRWLWLQTSANACVCVFVYYDQLADVCLQLCYYFYFVFLHPDVQKEVMKATMQQHENQTKLIDLLNNIFHFIGRISTYKPSCLCYIYSSVCSVLFSFHFAYSSSHRFFKHVMLFHFSISLLECMSATFVQKDDSKQRGSDWEVERETRRRQKRNEKSLSGIGH